MVSGFSILGKTGKSASCTHLNSIPSPEFKRPATRMHSALSETSEQDRCSKDLINCQTYASFELCPNTGFPWLLEGRCRNDVLYERTCMSGKGERGLSKTIRREALPWDKNHAPSFHRPFFRESHTLPFPGSDAITVKEDHAVQWRTTMGLGWSHLWVEQTTP